MLLIAGGKENEPIGRQILRLHHGKGLIVHRPSRAETREEIRRDEQTRDDHPYNVII
jgi:hypothetical protein